MLKPILVISAAALLNAGNANAAPLIYEPFAQTAGDLNSQAGGTGLNTWSDVSTVTVAETPTLSYGNLKNTGGQANVTTSTGTDAFVTTTSVLATSNLLDNGATLWFSYMFQKTAGGGPNEKGGFALGTERLDGAFNGTNMINSGYGVGVVTNNTTISAATWNGVTANGSLGGTDSLSYSTPTLIVGRIDWGATAGDVETITLFTPSTTDLNTPGTGFSHTVAGFDQTLLDTVSFTERNSGGNQIYDEIRFGATYADVTPVPEPGSLALLAVGGLLMVRRRRSLPSRLRLRC